MLFESVYLNLRVSKWRIGGRRKCLNFYFIWIEGILIPCLRTRLRDQIHRSSLPKMFFFCFCWLILSWKIGIWRMRERGLKGIRLWNCEVWLVIFGKKRLSMINFHWNLIKKIKEKINGILIPRIIVKMIWVVLFKFFGKLIFLSVNPKHSSNIQS